MSSAALQLFAFGQEQAAKRGLLLVDTKYEFGVDDQGEGRGGWGIWGAACGAGGGFGALHGERVVRRLAQASACPGMPWAALAECVHLLNTPQATSC